MTRMKVVNRLRMYRKRNGNNLEYKKLLFRCYYTCIIEYVIKRKDNFRISFGGRYIQSFPKRMLDWYRYILDSIYRFLLIRFNPNNHKTLKTYELIHFDVLKPIHPKIAKTPNEAVLYDFFEKNGFKIVDELLYSESTVYEIARV